jgi:hypothetical protein
MGFAFPKRENCLTISGLITPTETKCVGGRFFMLNYYLGRGGQGGGWHLALLGFRFDCQSFWPIIAVGRIYRQRQRCLHHWIFCNRDSVDRTTAGWSVGVQLLYDRLLPWSFGIFFFQSANLEPGAG